jgi:small-conductance mechanosensitive channel
MKKEILEALSTKFEGVDAKVLGRVAEKLASTVKSEDDIQAAVDGVTLQQIIKSEGDRRVNEAVLSTTKKLKEKYHLEDDDPENPDKQKGADDDDKDDKNVLGKTLDALTKDGDKGKSKFDPAISKMLQGIMDSQKKLTDEILSLKQEKTGNIRKAKLAEILKDAPEKIQKRYETDFGRMSFKDDDDFSAWCEEITPDIQDLSNTIIAKGAVTHSPKAGLKTDQTKVDPSVKARAEKIAAKESQTSSVISGLPESPAAK